MRKIKDIRIFANSHMNLDDDSRFLKENEHREIWNSMISVGEGSIGRLNKHIGTTNAFTLPINSGFTLPTGDFTCVGTCEDIETGSIIYALCDKTTTNHGFFRMFIEDYRLEWILKSQSYLNFKEDYPVSMDVINGLLYFTDGYFSSYLNNDFNPPRKINIEKAKNFTDKYDNRWIWNEAHEGYGLTGNPSYSGMTAYVGDSNPGLNVGDKIATWCSDGDCRYKPLTHYGLIMGIISSSGHYYVITDRIWGSHASYIRDGYIMEYEPDMYFGIDWQVIDRIKWPPWESPSVSFDDDTTWTSNLLRNSQFQVAYRWVYDDNERSTFSPFSDIALPSNPDLLNGTYDESVIKDNVLHIWYNTGPMEVRAIEIAIKNGNSGIWKLVERKYKFDQDGSVLIGSGCNDIYALYKFYNNEVGEPLDQIEVERPYDAVPQISAHQKLFEKNRLLDANYVEGYDNVDVDMELSVHASTEDDNTIIQEWEGYVAWNHYFPGPIFTLPGILNYAPPIVDLGSDYDAFVCYFFNFSYIYQPGYLWVISMEMNRIYGNITWDNYSKEYKHKKVMGVAVVDAEPGLSYSDFLDRVILQFRYGSNLSALITVRQDTTNGYNLFGAYTSEGDANWHEVTVGAENTIGVIFHESIYHGLDHLQYSVTKLTRGAYKHSSFKSGEFHKLGLVYFDRAGRCGAVNTSEDTTLYIPHDTETIPAHTLNINSLKWEINHQPPDWAEYFQLAYARGSSIKYFLQAVIDSIGISGESGYIHIDINTYMSDTKQRMPKFSVATYEWEEGDRLRFVQIKHDSNNFKTFTILIDKEITGIKNDYSWEEEYKIDNTGAYILDANGNKVLNQIAIRLFIKEFDYEALNIEPRNTIIEVYRPAKESIETTYEYIGEKIPILNPHTTIRYHGGGDNPIPILNWDRNQTGSLSARGVLTKGDVYVYTRYMMLVFPCESRWYSDFYNSDSLSLGRKNISNRDMRRQQYPSKIIYSGKLIQNTLINELSRVDSSDSFELSEKYGSINHIEEVGFTLKVFQTSKLPSVYIGRAGVTQPSSESKEILSSTKDVLGTLIVPESDYGTSHPGSVCKFERQLYFYDIYSGDILRDAGNGIQSLSKDYKIDAFIKAKSILFLQSGVDNVKVTSCYDHKNNVMFMTFIDSITPGNSFTIGFRNSQRQEEEGFISFYQFKPDYYGVMKQCMTAFKNEVLWIHNLGDTCNFYGTKYIASVKIVSNKEPITVKRFLTIAQSGNKVWDSPTEGDITIPITDTYQRGASSLLKAARYVKREGKFVSDFMKNMVTTSVTPKVSELITGDDLRGQVLEMTLYNNDDGSVELFAVEINSVESK